VLWLDGMCSKVRFQREAWMPPCAVAGEPGRAVAAYDEGGDLLYRCRHGFASPVQCPLDILVLLPAPATTRDARRGAHPDG
jgi:hypothetical protein